MSAVSGICECAALMAVGYNLRTSGLFKPGDGQVTVMPQVRSSRILLNSTQPEKKRLVLKDICNPFIAVHVDGLEAGYLLDDPLGHFANMQVGSFNMF
jgi:hypothetical protein